MFTLLYGVVIMFQFFEKKLLAVPEANSFRFFLCIKFLLNKLYLVTAVEGLGVIVPFIFWLKICESFGDAIPLHAIVHGFLWPKSE